MVYLYAGLGVLMISGIMAIFDMAVSFDAQQMRFRPARSDYSGSSAQQADQDLMRYMWLWWRRSGPVAPKLSA